MVGMADADLIATVENQLLPLWEDDDWIWLVDAASINKWDFRITLLDPAHRLLLELHRRQARLRIIGVVKDSMIRNMGNTVCRLAQIPLENFPNHRAADRAIAALLKKSP